MVHKGLILTSIDLTKDSHPLYSTSSRISSPPPHPQFENSWVVYRKSTFPETDVFYNLLNVLSAARPLVQERKKKKNGAKFSEKERRGGLGGGGRQRNTTTCHLAGNSI